MKRICRWGAVLLATALLAGLLITPIFAAQTTLKVEAPETLPKKGETFTVTLTLEGNPGLRCIQFTLGYDKAYLLCTEVNVSRGDLVKEMISAKNNRTETGEVLVAAASTDEITDDGTLLTLTFEALQDLKKYDFSMKDLLVADGEQQELAVTVEYPTGKAAETDPDSEAEDPVDPVDPVEPVDPDEDDDVPVFSDISGHWGESHILKAVQRGYFNGYADGSFGPNDAITRAQFVTVLWRSAGKPEPTQTAPFTDIGNLSAEFQKAIAWGYENGYVKGDGKLFNPNGGLTREMAMTILFRYSGGSSGMESLFTTTYDAYFTDSGKISAWAKPAMYWAYYNEVITGTGKTTLSPQTVTTRAQLAKILVEYMDRFVK